MLLLKNDIERIAIFYFGNNFSHFLFIFYFSNGNPLIVNKRQSTSRTWQYLKWIMPKKCCFIRFFFSNILKRQINHLTLKRWKETQKGKKNFFFDWIKGSSASWLRVCHNDVWCGAQFDRRGEKKIHNILKAHWKMMRMNSEQKNSDLHEIKKRIWWGFMRKFDSEQKNEKKSIEFWANVLIPTLLSFHKAAE